MNDHFKLMELTCRVNYLDESETQSTTDIVVLREQVRILQEKAVESDKRYEMLYEWCNSMAYGSNEE